MTWQAFEKALLDYDKPEVERLLTAFLQTENSLSFIEEYMVRALGSIGDKWEREEVALSQVYMSSKICEAIANELLQMPPMMPKKVPPIAIMTLDDYHTLGKRIVSAVIQSSGYQVLDFGTVTDSDQLIERLKSESVAILIISVLMYPTALKIQAIATQVRAHLPNLKILVGGAPFLMDERLWQDVGADAMGRSASDSVHVIEKWFEEGC